MKKVLIVDDSPTNVMALTNILQSDYAIETASSGFEALHKAIDKVPDMILLDVIMPDMDGFEVISKLKQVPELKKVPVIFITGLDDIQNEEKGLALGAIDYISKPFIPKIVKARVSTYIKLFEYQKSFEDLIWVDSLTGMYNRRAYDKYIESEWRRSKRNNSYISLAMIDIDFYKEYNDHYGHMFGDDLLRILVSAIETEVDKNDNYLARYGGDKFVFIMPSADSVKGQATAEKVLKAVSNLRIPHIRSQITDYVTVSIGGITAKPQKDDDIKNFVDLVNKMLCQAKSSGRNKVSWSVF